MKTFMLEKDQGRLSKHNKPQAFAFRVNKIIYICMTTLRRSSAHTIKGGARGSPI